MICTVKKLIFTNAYGMYQNFDEYTQPFEDTKVKKIFNQTL